MIGVAKFEGIGHLRIDLILPLSARGREPGPLVRFSSKINGVLQKRERAYTIDTLEARCTERYQLAIFRTLDAESRFDRLQRLARSHAALSNEAMRWASRP